MFPKNASDVEYPHEDKHRGTRLDRRDLVQAWYEAKPPGKVTGTLLCGGGTPLWPYKAIWGMEYCGERGDRAAPGLAERMGR